MKKVELNINNLTTLWKIASASYQRYFSDEHFEYAYIKNTQWPNRVWIKNPSSIHFFEKIKEKIGKPYKDLTFSYFNTHSKNIFLKNKHNLKLKSVQYGMSLPLKNKFITQKKIHFKQVENENEAQAWSNSFQKSFGYNISSQIILKTKEHIPFYLVYLEQELIGTVILFVTKNVVGIHSLGILPKKRKQGFATEIMHHILNKSIDKNLTLATLQASEMAKAMYLKIGFSIDFLMENYQLK